MQKPCSLEQHQNGTLWQPGLGVPAAWQTLTATSATSVIHRQSAQSPNCRSLEISIHHIQSILWGIIGSLLLAGCKTASPPPAAEDSADVAFEDAARVIVLVLDGVRIEESFSPGGRSAFGIETEALLPNIHSELVPSGTLVIPGFAVGTTATAPGHFELITGARQPFINAPDPDSTESYRPSIPTIFEAVRRSSNLSAEQTLFIVNTVHLASLEYSAHPGYGAELTGQYTYLSQENGTGPVQSDSQVIVELISHLREHDTRLAIANLHQIDRAGHAGEIEDYQSAIEDIDEPIVALWDWIQSTPGYADNTTLILTTDHGRHRSEEGDERWPSHSDQCSGCREIPIFLIGPEIKAGELIDTPYMIADVPKTIAHLLGTSLPNSTGVVMQEVLRSPPSESGLSGDVGVQHRREVTVTQRWLDTTEHRSEIVLSTVEGSETVSSEQAFIAEYPALTNHNDRYFTCWSELSLQLGDANEYEWTPACLSGAPRAWSSIVPPVPSIGSEWRPALGASEDGSLWMAYTINIDDTNQNLTGNGLWVLRFNIDDGGWLGLESVLDDSNFAADAALTLSGNEAFVAYTSSQSFNNPRSTRNIRLYHAAADEGSLALSPLGTTALEGTTSEADDEISWPWIQSVSADRLERPSLTVIDESLHVAALAYSNEKVSVVHFSTDISGSLQTEPEKAAPIGRVLAHITPQWDEDGALFWARYTEQNTVEICRLALGGVRGRCTDTGSGSIDKLSVDSGSTQVSVLDAEGVWKIQAVE